VATHLSILARLTEDSVDDRDVLFTSMQRFLEALATEQPSLLVLEDLQWADGSLLDLIESLFASLTGVPLMLLGLARPEFLESRAGWVSLPPNLTVHLEALHEAQSRELVLQLLSGRPADPDLASRVEQAAGGNPLVIEELAAWLSESGSDAAHWREAGASAKAADYLLTASGQAGRGWAQREAVELCNQALELIPDGDEVRRRRARLRRAVALMAQLHGGLDLPPGDQSK